MLLQFRTNFEHFFIHREKVYCRNLNKLVFGADRAPLDQKQFSYRTWGTATAHTAAQGENIFSSYSVGAECTRFALMLENYSI